jgi:hypothetical protein
VSPAKASGLVLAGLSRRRWQRVLALAYPVATTLVVVATANHWLMDAVVGAFLVRVAWRATAGAYAHLLRAQPVTA